MKKCFLVLDCGATNVRAIALDPEGRIVARAAVANGSESAAENGAWQQWSLEAIMQRFAACCQQIGPELQAYRLCGLSVTTFGVDGALVDEGGALLYPIISWKCPRTVSVMAKMAQIVSPETLQQITGVGQFSFNTLYKLAWLRKHHPERVDRAHAWLFISSLINHRLTGRMTTDLTMAGTSQLFDLHRRQFSEKILATVGMNADRFPELVAPGEVVGVLQPDAAALLGLPCDLPVISAGHDTQFALFGAGAGIDEPVLSSGTWEILMARTAQVNTAGLSRYPGATCELDSQAGLFNPGTQYMASGVLEWIRGLFWPPGTQWERIVAEAARIPAGAEGVTMNTQLLDSPYAGWQGVSLGSTPAHFYRAALEGLTTRLKENLTALEEIAQFSARELLLVGGGSRNALWNQMKADALGISVKVLDEAETTVLGASLYGWWGAGEAQSAEAARERVSYRYRYFYPKEQTDA
ncbi:L-fuculokinase [Pseudenterobacter timonensis]|uniref:L-fuculokinase n=1 Tax=Pseudenterobacter timonensis TaxID=1755099 RepID=A0ABV4A3A2_9ENTR